MDKEGFVDHIISLLKNIFPGEAEYYSYKDIWDLCINISWKIGTDPTRPNKRAKKIRIRIGEENIEDYLALSNSKQASADTSFVNCIQEKYRNFNPEHDTPYGQSTPIEEWILRLG